MNVQVSGHFGVGTKHAVHVFQRANFMLPDGIAGPKTMQALGVKPAAGNEPARLVEPVRESSPGRLAQQIGTCLCSPAAVARAAQSSPPMEMLHLPSKMATSKKGKAFIAKIEEKHADLYCPSDHSGVTVGIGFDFKERTAHEIETVFKHLLPPNEHSKISILVGAIKLQGDKAKFWVAKNKGLIHLNGQQMLHLLDHAIAPKEHTVRHDIHDALYQHQFDALVSFAYNPGGKWRSVSHLINHGKVTDAMKTIGSAVTSGGVMAGLVNRRQKEINLFLFGEYDPAAS
jgi:GH24 family phage-related lysozyme (muramidase)